MPKNRALLVTCEHGGNKIPADCRQLFRGRKPLLDSHRGYDRGALPLAQQIAGVLGAPLHYGTVSRLVVDLNRSPGNPHRFSEFTRGLPPEARHRLMESIHKPYWDAVIADVARLLSDHNRILHLSVHSFTPALRGTIRRAHVGLLYDPARPGEAEFCRKWQSTLQELYPSWVIRRNYPYKGTSDSLAVVLRREFPTNRFLSIELEVNQRVIGTVVDRKEGFAAALQSALAVSR